MFELWRIEGRVPLHFRMPDVKAKMLPLEAEAEAEIATVTELLQ